MQIDINKSERMTTFTKNKQKLYNYIFVHWLNQNVIIRIIVEDSIKNKYATIITYSMLS